MCIKGACIALRKITGKQPENTFLYIYFGSSAPALDAGCIKLERLIALRYFDLADRYTVVILKHIHCTVVTTTAILGTHLIPTPVGSQEGYLTIAVGGCSGKSTQLRAPCLRPDADAAAH